MKILHYLRRIALIYLTLVVGLSVVYWVIPPVSTLMLARWVTLRGVEREGVALHEVNRSVLRAVVRAEDGKFCQHYGVDWQSVWDAVSDDGGPSRGASTISMQVAKNLFLWPQRSYIRKAFEIPMAIYLDTLWSKTRMMEIYLSIAEWGNGVFGIEAAAQTYFGKHASELNAWEAARLVAMLPNPRKRNPHRPSTGYLKHAQVIHRWANADVDLSCLQSKKKK